MSPEDRQKAIRDAADKKYAELKKKKDAGATLSEDETKMLDRMEARHRMMEAQKREDNKSQAPAPAPEKK